METESIEKLHKVDDHIGIASAGHVADGRQLIDVARQQAQINRLTALWEPIGIEALTKAITDHMQEYTQTGSARPFGAALLMGGIENGGPRLFETDPGGASREWRAVAIGEHHDDLFTYLEYNRRDDLTLIEGIEFVLNALAPIQHSGLKPTEVGLAIVETETYQFTDVTTERTHECLVYFRLLVNESSWTIVNN